MPLTDTGIRSAKPKNKPQKLFDGGGLYLEVAPNGGKWWRLKYRYEGKEKRISLGVYPIAHLWRIPTSGSVNGQCASVLHHRACSGNAKQRQDR